jgi:hypothetical protein
MSVEHELHRDVGTALVREKWSIQRETESVLRSRAARLRRRKRMHREVRRDACAR